MDVPRLSSSRCGSVRAWASPCAWPLVLAFWRWRRWRTTCSRATTSASSSSVPRFSWFGGRWGGPNHGGKAMFFFEAKTFGRKHGGWEWPEWWFITGEMIEIDWNWVLDEFGDSRFKPRKWWLIWTMNNRDLIHENYADWIHWPHPPIMLPTPLQWTPKPIDPILNQGFVWPVLTFSIHGLSIMLFPYGFNSSVLHLSWCHHGYGKGRGT